MDFSSLTDDFFVNLDLQTSLPLPRSRDTVLHFCEAVQKQFPSMTNLFQRDTGEFVLEADREKGSYRWLELQPRRMSVGYFNPPDLKSTYELHEWLLDASKYFLGVGALDIEAIDVLFGFNMDYRGNRDQIVHDAVTGGSALATIVEESSAKPVECEPNIVMALDEECYRQARLNLETRCNSFQVRTGQYEDEPISVYFTVRQYPQPGKPLEMRESFREQCIVCEDLVSRIVIPNVIRPIAAAISASG